MLHAHSLIYSLIQVFLLKNMTWWKRCVSQVVRCVSLAVRDFNLSNPNISPIMGKYTYKMQSLQNNPDIIYVFLCCWNVFQLHFFTNCYHFPWAEFWANSSCLSQLRFHTHTPLQWGATLPLISYADGEVSKRVRHRDWRVMSEELSLFLSCPNWLERIVSAKALVFFLFSWVFLNRF